jgi:hypothetical protein
MTVSTLADGSARTFLNPALQHDERKTKADARAGPVDLNGLAQMGLQPEVLRGSRASRRLCRLLPAAARRLLSHRGEAADLD